jgi:hypothetical protein
MATTYKLEIVCPHCRHMTAIPDFPRARSEPIAFTCATNCGGHAYVEPPDLRRVPHVEVYIVTPRPMTPAQYRYATTKE